jgi:hypothetical protein
MPARLFTPLSITMEVAPLVTQLSIADSPEAMLDVERYRAAAGGEPSGGIYGIGAAVTVSTWEE